MTKSEKQHSTNMKTFRFGSSQVLPLTDRVIQQIPYLLGLVSFAEHTSTGFDDDGHIKLDPIINFRHFCIIIDTLPFQSLSQALIRLPKHEGLAAIMILIDYLGLIPMPYPTLNEIDALFLFASHNKHRGEHGGGETIKADLVQNMAAYFVLGLVRNEYDYRDVGVISQIQWCTMFIIQADKLFDPILRYQVQKANDHYFHILHLTVTSVVDKKEVSCFLEKHAAASSHYKSITDDLVYFNSAIIVWEFLLYDHIWFRLPKMLNISSDSGFFAYYVATEVFNEMKTEIWSKCTEDSSDMFAYNVRRTDLSPAKIRQLDRMDDHQIETNILQLIFEQLSMRQKVRATVTKLLPSYINLLEMKHKELIEDHRKISKNSSTQSRRAFSFIRLRTVPFESKIEWLRREILESENNLMKLRRIDQSPDEFCDSVLSHLYQLAIERIRYVISIRCFLSRLKKQEKILSKGIKCEQENLKIISKCQQTHSYKPIQKFPMKNICCKH